MSHEPTRPPPAEAARFTLAQIVCPRGPTPTPHTSTPANADPLLKRAGDLVDAAEEFQEVLRSLRAQVVGHEDAVERLALTALLHRRGARLQRVLLGGPAGAGKTHLARAVADVSGADYFALDCTALSETGFKGANLSELLDGLYAACDKNVERLARCVLVLDEFDKIAVPPSAEGASMTKHLAQQKCLLGLLGGGASLSIEAGKTRVSAEQMLILCTGAFSRSDWSEMTGEWALRGWDGRGEPSVEALIAYGFIPEIADRIKETLVLGERSVEEMVLLFRSVEDGVERSIMPLFAEMGYTLQVPSCTYRVAALRTRGKEAIGFRRANAELVKGAKKLLLDLLQGRSKADTEVRLLPEHLDL